MPRLLAFALLALAACGAASTSHGDPSSPAPASDPATDPASAPTPASSSAATPAPASSSASAIPTSCVGDASKACTPPADFVDRLCNKPHQDMALALFAKGTAWTRAYMRGKFDELQFDEEVLLLRFHAPPQNGMIVGSAKGSYDVLRWDGSCSNAVDADMITRSRPPRPKSARVQWHRLGSKMQDALLAGDVVKRAWNRRGKECRGAMTGDVSASCERADSALVDAVVDQVRAQGGLPEPDPIF